VYGYGQRNEQAKIDPEGSSSQDPHFPDLGQKTYLRCTIGKWKVDLDSEEALELT